jgi:predicted transcriptional regulator
MAGKGKPGPLTKEESLQREADMWRLRVEQSLTQQQIAERYGITQQSVSETLARAAGRISQDTAETARKAELHKLDIQEQRCLRIIEQHADQDNPMVLAAQDRLHKIGQRRDALLGLQAPVKSEVTSYAYTVNGVDPEALK